jgi:hypothetical protein
MAKIDDPGGKLREHYLVKSTDPATQITSKIAETWLKNIPHVGWVLGKVMDFLKSDDKDAKLSSFNNHLVEFYEGLGKDIEALEEQISSPEHIQMVAVAIERIFWGANERKAARFAAVVASTISFGKKEQDVEDAASFIRALDELSEDDLKVLAHLHQHQGEIVQENHAMPYNSFFQDNRMRIMLEQAANLGIQMDEFYARCGRLTGYGLAIPLERRPDSVGPDSFAFRITLLGKRLILILLNAERIKAAAQPRQGST